MGMGIVSDADFEKELEINSVKTPDTTIPSIIDMPSKGRGNGNREVPDALRKIIGEESVTSGREAGIELARQFGISPSSVSAYANGAHSTASYNEPTEVKSHITSRKAIITKRAINKLGLALKSITTDKLDAAKLTELSAVAKDMSAIVKNMEPETSKNSGDGVVRPQFVFYAPQFRDERNFDVVIAKDER